MCGIFTNFAILFSTRNIGPRNCFPVTEVANHKRSLCDCSECFTRFLQLTPNLMRPLLMEKLVLSNKDTHQCQGRATMQARVEHESHDGGLHCSTFEQVGGGVWCCPPRRRQGDSNRPLGLPKITQLSQTLTRLLLTNRHPNVTTSTRDNKFKLVLGCET